MNSTELNQALRSAVEAAESVGDLLRKNRLRPKRIHQASAHDIKLILDIRSQEQITTVLHRLHPDIDVLGEEYAAPGTMDADYRWVVDPIDGTVNYTSGIPHACVSIALEARLESGEYESTVGVIYDPFNEELWTARKGGPALRNGRKISPSRHPSLGECVVSLGFAQSDLSLNTSLQHFTRLMPRVRKLRIMGSAALSLAYVADGRFDAYLEAGLRRWDIAAGRLIVEQAGGIARCTPLPAEHAFALKCHNGHLEAELALLHSPNT